MCGPSVQKAVQQLWKKQSFSIIFSMLLLFKDVYLLCLFTYMSDRLLFCNLVCLNKWKLQICHHVIYYHNYCNKVAFLSPTSSKTKRADEKERRKRRSEEKGRRRREKRCWMEKVYLPVMFSKIQLDINICISLQCMYGAGRRSYLINEGILWEYA